MPILKRLGEDGQEERREKPKQQPRPTPEIIKGRPGRPSISMRALQERIEAQVQAEIGRRADILLEAQDEAARRQIVRAAGEYVLAIEAVTLTADERAALFDAVYRNIFSFGPLDAFVADDTVSELMIDGYDTVYIRRQMGEPERVPSYFEDPAHLQRIVERIVTGAGGQLWEGQPFIEVGLTMLGRPVRLTLVCPPLSPVLHVDLRLHPRQMTTMERLRVQGAIAEADEALLLALARSPYGALIVSDGGGGKTTLLEALLPHLPDPASCWLVERAAEMRPPPACNRRQALPATETDPGIDFAARIAEALDQSPATLILDELRGDEAGPVWRALSMPDGPRCLLVLRSGPDPRRLRNAFSILIRKGQPGLPQEAINQALLERLPFVITTAVEAGSMRVTGVGEWAADEASGEVTLWPLIRNGEKTGRRPRHRLAVDEGFWGA